MIATRNCGKQGKQPKTFHGSAEGQMHHRNIAEKVCLPDKNGYASSS
jgi:hypothetical protein